MKRAAIILAGIAVLGVPTAVVLYSRNKIASLEGRAEQLRLFCMATKDAMHSDWRAFSGEDPVRREEAYARFYEGSVMYHNVPSIQMCTVKPIPTLQLRCRLEKDWNCLAETAKRIKELL